MRTKAICEMIREAVADEERTRRSRRLFDHTARQSGAIPTGEAVREVVCIGNAMISWVLGQMKSDAYYALSQELELPEPKTSPPLGISREAIGVDVWENDYLGFSHMHEPAKPDAAPCDAPEVDEREDDELGLSLKPKPEVFVPSAPPTDTQRTRKAWPHLKCDEAVLIGTPFELEVGLGPERDRNVRDTGALVLPSEGCTLQLQLMFDPASFAITEGRRAFNLEVNKAEPYPRRTVKLVALDGQELTDRRDISVAYSLQGVLCGFASRGVLALRNLAQAPLPEATTPFAGIDLADSSAGEKADLTIAFKRGDQVGGGRLAFAIWSPHFALPIAKEPPTVELGSQPAKFLEHILRTANTNSTPFSLFTALKGLGRQHIANKLPALVKDALRRVVAHVAPRTASVLIISDDPYIPWEFAVIEPPLGSEPSPFLGAQVALGRWILPSGERPAPYPSRHLAVREQAVVTGVYDRIPGWKRLDQAEEEAVDLQKAWKPTGQRVEATFEGVVKCLGGDPAADVLHFALHGRFDATGLQEGLVLIERPAGESNAGRPTFLRPEHVSAYDFTKFSRAPFVFLNACQVGAGRELLGDYAGMAAAFLFAGASAVVAPLWSIDDADARNFALKFYEECWNGEAPAELLRRQRARFTESAARQKSVGTGSPTHLAYQFFGHPRFVLERHTP